MRQHVLKKAMLVPAYCIYPSWPVVLLHQGCTKKLGTILDRQNQQQIHACICSSVVNPSSVPSDFSYIWFYRTPRQKIGNLTFNGYVKPTKMSKNEKIRKCL